MGHPVQHGILTSKGIVIFLVFFDCFVSVVSLDWTDTLGHCRPTDKLIIRHLLYLVLNFLCEIILSILNAHHFLLFQRIFTTL